MTNLICENKCKLIIKTDYPQCSYWNGAGGLRRRQRSEIVVSIKYQFLLLKKNILASDVPNLVFV